MLKCHLIFVVKYRKTADWTSKRTHETNTKGI